VLKALVVVAVNAREYLSTKDVEEITKVWSLYSFTDCRF
jgi:hypothetical protein